MWVIDNCVMLHLLVWAQSDTNLKLSCFQTKKNKEAIPQRCDGHSALAPSDMLCLTWRICNIVVAILASEKKRNK